MAHLLIITGPTASGKSSLGVRLAANLGGEVVNLDSVQVYRGADIGSAKLSIEERAGIPHHLIDVCEPHQSFSAGEFITLADAVIRDITGRGKVPVIVGGTTMYLTSLLHGMAPLGGTNTELRRELEPLTNAELVARLETLDAVTAKRLHLNDRVRLIRAIEIASSGTQPSELLKSHGYERPRYAATVFALWWERRSLLQRIAERTEFMLQAGLIEETETLLAQAPASANLFRAVGYRDAVAFLQGGISSDELATRINQHTSQLVKRQLTYLRNEPTKRGWEVSPSSGLPGTVSIPDHLSRRGAITSEKSVFPWDTAQVSRYFQEHVEKGNGGVKFVAIAGNFREVLKCGYTSHRPEGER